MIKRYVFKSFSGGDSGIHIMEKSFCIILSLAAVVSIHAHYTFNTVYGGLAFSLGAGSSDMNPGLNLGVDQSTMVAKCLALGGHIDYTWLSVQNRLDFAGSKAGFHFIDIGVVPKLVGQVATSGSIFFEIDPAFFIVVSYLSDSKHSGSHVDPYFGLTYGTGLIFLNTRFAVKLKTVYTDSGIAKWFNFCFGFPM